MGEDQIPSKLIKTAGNFFVEPLTDIINCCFSTSTFPDLAKKASVIPIGKGDTDKHIYTNYKPVSALNTSFPITAQHTQLLLLKCQPQNKQTMFSTALGFSIEKRVTDHCSILVSEAVGFYQTLLQPLVQRKL